MTQLPASGPVRGLFNSLRTGDITRRQFIERSSMLGVGAGVAVFLANTAQVGAQEASPATTDASSAVRPSVGTEGQTRGEVVHRRVGRLCQKEGSKAGERERHIRDVQSKFAPGSAGGPAYGLKYSGTLPAGVLALRWR
jgi:hypothetical protein